MPLKDKGPVGFTDQFHAKYEPKEILGTGASSVVRLCTRKDNNSDFAVKIIDFNSGFDDPETLKVDVLREISILTKVRGHENIIKLYDTFEGDICPYGDLFDYLTKSVNLSEKKTKLIMRQILSAVSYMHDKGVIHRDLKPENILLNESLSIKITDFGLAAMEDEKDELCEIRGTPGYLAPEILRSGYYDDTEPYSFPVDIWACGVIMYTLLFGCPPFWNRKEHLMLRAIMEGKYSFPQMDWNEIKDSTKNLISRMLCVDIATRITPNEALKHEFFYKIEPISSEKSRRNLRQIFKATIISVIFINFLKNLRDEAVWLSVEILSFDPYRNRKLRKIIDSISFDIYKQWVKKGEEQNRAALFENAIKKMTTTADHSSKPENESDSESEDFNFDEDFDDHDLYYHSTQSN